MTARRSLALGISITLTTRACATRVEVPEIPLLDSPAFMAATREPEPKPAITYVEVPNP